jgi:hypothetical protein
MSDLLIIILAILSAPIWIPLGYFVGLAVIGLILSFIGAMIAIVVYLIAGLFDLFGKKI